MGFTKSTSTYTILDGTYYREYSGDFIDSYSRSPAKVTGVWKTLHNGARFRMPTAYGRSKHQLYRQRPLLREGRDVWNSWPVRITTGPGGWDLDNYFSGNWVYVYSSAFDLPSLAYPPAFASGEENEAITKSLNKLADAKVNLAENLATLGQTARMFIRPVRSIINRMKEAGALADKMNRRMGGSGFSVAESLLHMSYREMARGRVGSKLAEMYLEYVYGFAPLMQDVYELYKLMKDTAALPLLMKGRGSSERYLSAPDITQHNISAGMQETWSNAVAHSKTRCNVWATPNPEYAFTRSLNQLGLVNPADLVWELVPYSFVVDWVLPIGPVLQAMTAPAGLDFVGGAISRRLTAYWDYTTESTAWSGSSRYNVSRSDPATGTMAYEGYTRKVLSNWPTPGLWFAPDPLGFSRDGSDRAIKALALAISGIPRSGF